MKKATVFLLALSVFTCALPYYASAGSAVAVNSHNQLVTSYGYPKEIAKRRALEIGHRRYGAGVKILAATDVFGYGAVAVAPKGVGSVVGIALGRASPAEAERLAIEQCLSAGGTNPKVKWEWKG
jgi:hypothetical protein